MKEETSYFLKGFPFILLSSGPGVIQELGESPYYFDTPAILSPLNSFAITIALSIPGFYFCYQAWKSSRRAD